MTNITIVGNLTKDPEQKATAQGTSVTNFLVAVTQQGGEPAYYSCSAFGRTAENCAKYLKKGRKVAVRGELSVTVQENGKTYLNVRADGVEFLPNAEKPVTANDFADVTSTDIPF